MPAAHLGVGSTAALGIQDFRGSGVEDGCNEGECIETGGRSVGSCHCSRGDELYAVCNGRGWGVRTKTPGAASHSTSCHGGMVASDCRNVQGTSNKKVPSVLK